jgi:hypothetical protein
MYQSYLKQADPASWYRRVYKINIKNLLRIPITTKIYARLQIESFCR